jgi:hypothetical protein
VKQCPAASPPELVFEEELEPLDDEDEADEDVVPGAVIARRSRGKRDRISRRRR